MPESDHISVLTFLVEARRRAPQGFTDVSGREIADPLSALMIRIGTAPDTMEHRVLARLIQGIIATPAELVFRRADLATLSPAVLTLLSAFIDDHLGGRYTPDDLRSAQR